MRRARPSPEALRARSEALRAALRQDFQRRLRKLQRGRARPGKSAEPPDRRRWWLAALALVLLLLLLRDCEEPVPAVALAPAPAPVPLAGPPAPAPAPEPAPAPVEPVPRRPRPAYESEPPEPLPWIAALRMQVAARSPRLAECFVGAAQPGRLKWTAAVEPGRGVVSEHTLEPMLSSDLVTHEQRACVIGVLSDPPYRLDGGERATPSRVGMVIEF